MAEALGCTPDEVDSAVVGEEEPDMVVAHFKAPPPEDTPHPEEPGFKLGFGGAWFGGKVVLARISSASSASSKIHCEWVRSCMSASRKHEA